jgi:Na+-driven multidrug efflux pump
VVSVLSNLMVPLAGLISTAFLGHLPQVSSLAGVALATVLFNYIYWTFGFLRMGTTGLTAQAAGQGDRDRVLLVAERIKRLARHAIWLLPVLAVGSLTWMLDGYFLGLTESKILRTSAMGAAVGFAPLAALAWQQHSKPLLWLAVTAYMVGRLIPLTLRVGTVGDR